MVPILARTQNNVNSVDIHSTPCFNVISGYIVPATGRPRFKPDEGEQPPSLQMVQLQRTEISHENSQCSGSERHGSPERDRAGTCYAVGLGCGGGGAAGWACLRPCLDPQYLGTQCGRLGNGREDGRPRACSTHYRRSIEVRDGGRRPTPPKARSSMPTIRRAGFCWRSRLRARADWRQPIARGRDMAGAGGALPPALRGC